MADKLCIEHTAHFYRVWEIRHVEEATRTLDMSQESWLTKELDEWYEGLRFFGWSPEKASDFVSDMRLWLKRRRIRGPHWRS